MAKKKISLIFATFSPWQDGKRMPTNGMIEPMLSFFLSKTSLFSLIDLPHPGSDRVMPIIEIYKAGKAYKNPKSSILLYLLYPFLLARNTVGTRIPFKIRDFLAILDFGLRNKHKYDLFIGLESINAIAGVILRKFGITKRVVYYVSDYSPQRYKTGWFNKIYLWLDRVATTNVDFIWDVSLAMMPARINAGLNKNFAAKVIHVPNALFPKQINYLPFEKTEPFRLAYAGTLGPENGPDIAIKSMKYIVKRYPKTKLHIYGGGKSDLKRLNRLTERLKLKKHVIFHGFITNQITLSNEIKKYWVGLAPYKAIPGSPRFWADATKIRLYLAAGLPVVTTYVPPLGKELVEKRTGIVTKDTPQETAKAVIKLFSDEKYYKTLKRNAIKAAKNNTWENTYSHALRKMQLEINS